LIDGRSSSNQAAMSVHIVKFYQKLFTKLHSIVKF
jgi:hypothetical protein